jgi:lipopolysaccharide transport system permease protein
MQINLILDFTRQDFIDRYAGSALGIVWALIHPLVMIFIFTVIFAQIMAAKLPGSVGEQYSYPIYLVSGLLPWMAFTNTLMRCSTVFLDKRHIIGKIHITLAYLPIYIILSEAMTFGIAFAIFLAFLFITDHVPGQLLLIVPYIFVLQQILALGLGLIFGIFNVFLRDIKELVGILITFWFWLTPIVWVLTIAPERIQTIQEYSNPAYFFIAAYHDIFAHHRLPDIAQLSYLAIIAHGCLLFAWMLLKWLEKDIRDFL